MPSMESMYGTSNPMLAGQSRNNLLWFFLIGILAGYMYLIPSQAASLPEKQEARLWFQLWSSDVSNQTRAQRLRGLCTMKVYPCLQEFWAFSYFSIIRNLRARFSCFSLTLHPCIPASASHGDTKVLDRRDSQRILWSERRGSHHARR